MVHDSAEQRADGEGATPAGDRTAEATADAGEPPRDAPAPSIQHAGPFSVRRVLTRAPGLLLAEGLDADDDSWLLQLVPLRSSDDGGDPGAVEAAAARQTAAVRSYMHVEAHGVDTGPDGRRVIYWALPWVSEAPVKPTLEALPSVGRALGQWLAGRHAEGRTHPLLSAEVVRMDAQGQILVTAVPVAVHPRWIDPGLPPPPLAPEESKPEWATMAGDLWRLGHAVRDLAGAGGLPEDLARWVERLTADAPARRPRSALEAVELLGDPLTSPQAGEPAPARRVSSIGQVPAVLRPRGPRPEPPGDARDLDRIPTLPEAVPAPARWASEPPPVPAAEAPAPPAHEAAAPVARVVTAVAPPPSAATEHEATALVAEVAPVVTPPSAATEHEATALVAEVAPVVAPPSAATEHEALVPEAAPAVAHPSAATEPLGPDAVPRGPDAITEEGPAVRDAVRSDTGGAAPALERAPLTAAPEAITEEGPALRGAARRGTAPALERASLTVVGALEIPEDSTGPTGVVDLECVLDDDPNPSEPPPGSRRTAARAVDPTMVDAEPETEQPPEPRPQGAAGDALLDLPLVAAVEDLPELSPSEVEIIEPEPSAARSASYLSGTDPAFDRARIRARGGEASLPADMGEDTAGSVPARTSVRARPVVAAHDSPWSEVAPLDPRQPLSRVPPTQPVQSAPLAPEDRVEADGALSADRGLVAELRARWAAPGAGAQPSRMVAVVAVLLVLLGLVAMMQRAAPPVDEPPPAAIRADSDLVLTSDPTGAEVIAEADGRLLGRTPLTLMTPEGASLAVLVTLPDRVPMRVVLPTSGALQVNLPAAPADHCEVTVTAEAPVTEHRGTQVVPGTIALAGGAVFRREGAGRKVGGYLIRCPEASSAAPTALPLRPARRKKITIAAPKGVEAFADGQPLGPLPATTFTERAFIQIRLEASGGRRSSRWLGVAADTVVRLPMPASPPAPAVEAPQPTPVATDARLRIRRSKANRSYRRGRRALAAGRNATARRAFRRCIKADADFAECHRGLAIVYRKLQQPRRSDDHYRRYLELRPDAEDADRIRRLLER